MTTFRYAAARRDGSPVRGEVTAPSPGQAAALLSERGLFPLDVAPVPDAPVAVVPWRRPGARAAAVALRSLAALVAAGVPLGRALEATAAVVPRTLGPAMTRVRDRVREGASLATALASEGDLVPPVTIGLVRAGERGMGLDRALALAARQLEQRAELDARVRAALAYPLLLLVVGLVSLGLILVLIVPRFADLLSDVPQALPASTRLLLAASGVARHGGGATLAGITVAVALGVTVLRRHRARWHTHLLRVPLVGPLRHALASARAARALGALLEAGGAILHALDAAREAAGDVAVADRLARVRREVAEGRGLSEALARADALTPLATQLTAIGEGAGTLPDLLARAADLDEAHVERQLKVLVALLEPALIIAFAVAVALVAAALLQAIYAVRPGGL